MGKTFSTGLLTNGIWQDASNNIGIGGSPSGSYKFDVTGTGRFTGALTGLSATFSQSAGNSLQVFQTTATNATTAIIRQTGAGGNGNQDIGLLVDIQGANDSDRIANFRYYNGSTYSSRLLIQRGGNIGINITNPPARLTLSQASDGLTNGFRLYRGNGTDWQEMFMSSGFGVLNDTLTFYSSFAGRNVAGIDRSGMIASITAGADSNYLPAFVAVYTANNNESNAISTAVSSNGASSGFRFDVSNGAGSTGRTASFYINRGSVSAPSDLYVGGQGYKPGGGSWANSSDIRLKENVKTIDNALDKVLKFRGVTFDWKEGYTEFGKKESAGFIADEIMEIFPEWVTETNASDTQKEIIEDDKIKSLSLPFHFDALLVEAIKEISNRLSALENKS
jgi:hypothetical protein